MKLLIDLYENMEMTYEQYADFHDRIDDEEYMEACTHLQDEFKIVEDRIQQKICDLDMEDYGRAHNYDLCSGLPQ
jgi:hypothetical protein